MHVHVHMCVCVCVCACVFTQGINTNWNAYTFILSDYRVMPENMNTHPDTHTLSCMNHRRLTKVDVWYLLIETGVPLQLRAIHLDVEESRRHGVTQQNPPGHWKQPTLKLNQLQHRSSTTWYVSTCVYGCDLQRLDIGLMLVLSILFHLLLRRSCVTLDESVCWMP